MPDRRFLCDVYDAGYPAGIKEKPAQRGSNSGCQCSFTMTCHKSCQYSCLKVQVLQSVNSNIQTWRGNCFVEQIKITKVCYLSTWLDILHRKALQMICSGVPGFRRTSKFINLKCF
jgi:hypothetical protein